MVMIQCCRVGMAAVPMCHPRVSRSRQLMRHNGGHALKSQAHRERLKASPLNSVECGLCLERRDADDNRRPHAISHNKVIIIDGEMVLTGSFNFTKAAQEKNAENLLIIRNPAVVPQ